MNTTDTDAGLDITRAEFERACSLLPPEFVWGLPVTPRLVLDIAQAATSAQVQTEPVRNIAQLALDWVETARKALKKEPSAADGYYNGYHDALATTPQTDGATVAVELSGVDEVLSEGEGFWRECSGCYETEDGHPVGHYPYSEVLKCYLGNGCSECGGLGAIWDNTDYEAMAHDFERELAATHAPAMAETQTDAARYRWLRNEHFPTADNPPLAQVVWKAFDNRHSSDWANMVDGNDLDRAIDAAIAAASGGEQR